MGDMEIQTATEVSYRWRCHRCGEDGPYDSSRDEVESWAEAHEERLCAARKHPIVTERI